MGFKHNERSFKMIEKRFCLDCVGCLENVYAVGTLDLARTFNRFLEKRVDVFNPVLQCGACGGLFRDESRELVVKGGHLVRERGVKWVDKKEWKKKEAGGKK